MAQLLYNRGVSPQAAPSFLDPDLFHAPAPFLLPDMGKAVNRINVALTRGETIGVFGDFDVDGMTATTVLSDALSGLGARTLTYVPNRFTQGHGLHASGVRFLKEKGASLVITCDCGTSDLAEADEVARMKVDLIVTDHHVPLTTLPKAVAVVNAKRRDSAYPFTEFAGVGTAFKLMQALYYDKDPSRLEQLLELVALGTVADMVALTGENRTLVHRGLRALNTTTRPGLLELIKVSGLTPGSITSGDISWALGPRINSSGRMENTNSEGTDEEDPGKVGTNTSLRLLTTTDPEEAEQLAGELNEMNGDRQQRTADVYGRVSERLRTRQVRPLLFDADPTYEEGVIGLVAGKVSKEYYRPAVVVNSGDVICHGSARSIPEFDLAAALEQCSELLRSFGGHPLAAGFSVTRDKLPLLEERLVALAEARLAGLDLRPSLDVDAEVSLKSLSGETFRLTRALEPFGQQNPEPCFLTRGVEVLECRSFRNHEKWTSLRLKEGRVAWDAVDFRTLRGPDDVPQFIDVVYTLRTRLWQGEEVLQANIVDFAPAR